MRVGIGHDTHRLAAGGPLRLGGIDIPHDKHAVGHSDADVLLHAITDALLGAAALGDIGQHFPNDEAEWKDMPSIFFLRTIKTHLEREGWRILNIDATLIAEKPKVMKKADAIRHT